MASNFYGATSLIGGGAGALDAIDGAALVDLDGAFVVTASGVYFYTLSASSGAAESSPGVISPDTNAGTKRWIRQAVLQSAAQVIDVSSTSAALRVTQTGTGNVVEFGDSANPDTTPTIINASGQMVQGYQSALSTINFVDQAQTPAQQQISTGNGGVSNFKAFFGSTNYAPQDINARSLSTTAGEHAAVTSGSRLYELVAQGSDGTSFVNSTQLEVTCSGTVSTGVVPGKWDFKTANSSGTMTSAFVINSDARVYFVAGPPFLTQSTPAAKTTVVTLTAAELLAGLITGTPTAGDTAYTLPLGTATETALGPSIYANGAFDWSLINLATGSNTITITANTGHTIVGNALVAISTSSMWRTRRTAANTYVTYRLR